MKDWKKILAVAIAGYVAPTVVPWAQSVLTGADVPFTVGNVIAPNLQSIVTTTIALAALWTQKPGAPVQPQK